jgi:sirohydrochlorin ferrochelatase
MMNSAGKPLPDPGARIVGVALIVSHGQPSDPAPAEAELAALAAQVAQHLPGWHVGSATLADPEALGRALLLARAASGREGGLVYPMFMAQGWFTRTHLPERLAAAGGTGWTPLLPFGCDEAVQARAVAIVAEALAEALPAQEGQDRGALHPAPRRLLLAAHGSFRSPAPAEVARQMAGRIATDLALDEVRCGFIDQTPQIAEVAAGLGNAALCLPFFAARGGHVIDDLPQALAEAGFTGRVLPPLGLDAAMPGLIARGLEQALGDDGPRNAAAQQIA